MTKLTAADLSLLRERSIRNFVQLQPRARLKGMTRDLTEEECRLLAMLDAAAETLIHLGAADSEKVCAVGLETFQQTSKLDQVDE